MPISSNQSTFGKSTFYIKLTEETPGQSIESKHGVLPSGALNTEQSVPANKKTQSTRSTKVKEEGFKRGGFLRRSVRQLKKTLFLDKQRTGDNNTIDALFIDQIPPTVMREGFEKIKEKVGSDLVSASGLFRTSGSFTKDKLGDYSQKLIRSEIDFFDPDIDIRLLIKAIFSISTESVVNQIRALDSKGLQVLLDLVGKLKKIVDEAEVKGITDIENLAFYNRNDVINACKACLTFDKKLTSSEKGRESLKIFSDGIKELFTKADANSTHDSFNIKVLITCNRVLPSLIERLKFFPTNFPTGQNEIMERYHPQVVVGSPEYSDLTKKYDKILGIITYHILCSLSPSSNS